VAELDEVATIALARAALAGTPIEVDADSRETLVRRGLVRVEPSGCIGPYHDVIASAVIDAISADARQQIHRELAASATDIDARAMHASAGGDDATAVTAARAWAANAVTVSARAEALRIVAAHTRPPVRAANRVAADALSLAGRYREALDLLGPVDDASVPDPADAVIRARAHWAITEIDDARAAIERGLGDGNCDDAAATVELLSLRSRIRCRVDWDLAGAIDDGRRAVDLAARA